MDRPRAYFASLSDYNAGRLYGTWIEASTPDEVRRQIAEMLAGSPTAKEEGTIAEEWAIHDYDGFGSLRLGEWEDIETLCSLADGVEEHGDAFLAFAAHSSGGDVTVDDFQEKFRGEWSSLADYVEDYWEQSGIEEPPNWWHPLRYTDWDRMAEDLRMSGDVWTTDAPGGGVYVFEGC